MPSVLPVLAIDAQQTAANLNKGFGTVSAMPNPYQPPPPTDLHESWWQKLKRQLSPKPRPLSSRFADDSVTLHYGVAFIVDHDDPDRLHAALPSSEATEQRMRRNVDEVLRVLPDFIAENPNLHALLRGRNLVVRMIQTYEDLSIEQFSRVELGSDVVDAAIEAATAAELED
jgi:hypothetical protein